MTFIESKEPTESAKPVESSEQVESNESAESVKSTQPAESTEQPVESTETKESSVSAEPVESTEVSEAVAEEKPAEPAAEEKLTEAVAEEKPAEPVAEEKPQEQPRNVNRSWYIVHTYSGHEDKVKANLERNIDSLGLKWKLQRIVIPTEEVVEVKKNKRYVKKRKFFPGYIMVDMVVDNDTYWIVRNTPGVTGFLGGVKPVPLPDEEVKNILELIEAPSTMKPKPAVLFDKGESVRIIDGPFRHFIGTVEEINSERGKLKVMVSIFGRPTPVELDFLQVEKL